MPSILVAPLAVLFILLSSANAQVPSVPTPLTYIHAGHLFDPATGRYRDNVTLVVANQRVQSIEGAGFRPPADGQVVDLSSEYVLPGLIDCHTHLGNRADRYDEIDKFKDTPFDSAIAASSTRAKRSRPGLPPCAM